MENLIYISIENDYYCEDECLCDDEGDCYGREEYRSNNILSFSVVEKNSFYDLIRSLPIEKDKSYYLLYGTYSSGDSFSTSSGNIEYVDLYNSFEEAEEVRKILEENAENFRKEGLKTGNFYSAKIKTHSGKELDFHCPWNGYFESLTDLAIVELCHK